MSAAVQDNTDTPMSDINTTPLVDVMLVLLIIFLIAVPVVIQSIDLKLPNVKFDPTTTKPENVLLSIRGAPDGSGKCEVYWGMTPMTNKEIIPKAVEKLKAEIEKQGGVSNPKLELPEVHIRGDVNTPYQCIGGAIYAMQLAGFQKVGFISEPPPGTAVVRM